MDLSVEKFPEISEFKSKAEYAATPEEQAMWNKKLVEALLKELNEIEESANEKEEFYEEFAEFLQKERINISTTRLKEIARSSRLEEEELTKLIESTGLDTFNTLRKLQEANDELDLELWNGSILNIIDNLENKEKLKNFEKIELYGVLHAFIKTMKTHNPESETFRKFQDIKLSISKGDEPGALHELFQFINKNSPVNYFKKDGGENKYKFNRAPSGLPDAVFFDSDRNYTVFNITSMKSFTGEGNQNNIHPIKIKVLEAFEREYTRRNDGKTPTNIELNARFKQLNKGIFNNSIIEVLSVTDLGFDEEEVYARLSILLDIQYMVLRSKRKESNLPNFNRLITFFKTHSNLETLSDILTMNLEKLRDLRAQTEKMYKEGNNTINEEHIKGKNTEMTEMTLREFLRDFILFTTSKFGKETKLTPYLLSGTPSEIILVDNGFPTDRPELTLIELLSGYLAATTKGQLFKEDAYLTDLSINSRISKLDFLRTNFDLIFSKIESMVITNINRKKEEVEVLQGKNAKETIIQFYNNIRGNTQATYTQDEKEILRESSILYAIHLMNENNHSLEEASTIFNEMPSQLRKEVEQQTLALEQQTLALDERKKRDRENEGIKDIANMIFGHRFLSNPDDIAALYNISSIDDLQKHIHKLSAEYFHTEGYQNLINDKKYLRILYKLDGGIFTYTMLENELSINDILSEDEINIEDSIFL